MYHPNDKDKVNWDVFKMPSTKPGGRGGAIVEQGDAVVQSERGGLAPVHKKKGPDILLLQAFFRDSGREF